MRKLQSKNQSTRLLWIGLIVMCISCTCVFSYLIVYMNRSTSETISEVGTIYMQGLNERINQHFRTTIDYQFSYVSELIRRVPPKPEADQESLRQELELYGESKSLEYLGLYSADGTGDSYGKEYKTA